MHVRLAFWGALNWGLDELFSSSEGMLCAYMTQDFPSYFASK
jgi:hypothetical protein